ncbi:MAG: helix-turn-helix transcriptional regulator [Clostridiales bacterium]|nr:helix-turn-helix transcriptional regulator [Clostridiales bacterium]
MFGITDIEPEENENNKRVNFDEPLESSELVAAVTEVRRSIGITQSELAERTGIAQSYISKMENGGAKPSLRTLIRLIDGMDYQLRFTLSPKQEEK